MSLNINEIRAQFPILRRKIHGKPLVYLDNGATTQKPDRVIGALAKFYSLHNANIHRGLHTLSNESTDLYESAHLAVSEFIGAGGIEEIVFTRNTTESLNLIVQSWGRKNLKKDDVVVITKMEHHSNIVPWQMLEKTLGIRIAWVPISDDGRLEMDEYVKILEANRDRVKVVSTLHISNVLGTINPIDKMCEMAHDFGAIFIVDAAQSVARVPVDVKDIDCDFLVFSSHKMYGPTGIGVLYGKKDLLEEMDPWMGGGDMIIRVNTETFEVADLPWKFEAGTPNIADGAVLPEAINFIKDVGFNEIQKHERMLVKHTMERLTSIEGVRIVGPSNPEDRMAVVSFDLEGVHPHDIASLLDEEGVAVRAGQHCAMPLHIRFGIQATTRVSFAVYNTREDVDVFAEGLEKVRGILT